MKKKIASGAEAIVFLCEGKIIKQRVPKAYRDKQLDAKIIKTRNKQEASLLKRARNSGVNAPVVIAVGKDSITMEKIDDSKEHKKYLERIGKDIAKLHNNWIIHGDLNLSNIATTKKKKVYFLDFGLGYLSKKTEDRATDLLVFKRTLKASKSTEKYWERIEEGYRKESKDKNVIPRISEIERRGRYL